MKKITSIFVTILIILTGCSKSHDKPESEKVVCSATKLARENFMKFSHITFTQLTAETIRTETNAGISSMLYLSLPTDIERLGPYEAVISYLVNRNMAWNPEFAGEIKVPSRTKSVIKSASKLDEDIRNGICEK